MIMLPYGTISQVCLEVCPACPGICYSFVMDFNKSETGHSLYFMTRLKQKAYLKAETKAFNGK